MFDIEKAVLEWREEMAARGINAPEILDELENHLRDEIASRTSSGCGEENAFNAAIKNIGDGTALQAEFAKVSEGGLRSNTFLKRSCRVAALFMLLINTWTLLSYELSALQRWFGIIAVTVICGYLACLPYWLEAFRGYRLPWLTSLIKTATVFIWLWPVVVLLETQRILRPRARKALQLASREAKAMNRSLIGAEDLLVGLLREGSGVGAQALRNLGVHVQKARAEISNESHRRVVG